MIIVDVHVWRGRGACASLRNLPINIELLYYLDKVAQSELSTSGRTQPWRCTRRRTCGHNAIKHVKFTLITTDVLLSKVSALLSRLLFGVRVTIRV